MKNLVYLIPLYFLRLLFPKKRTVAYVEKNYDSERAKLYSQLENTSFKNYIHGGKAINYSLQAWKIEFGPLSRTLYNCKKILKKS